MKKLIVLILAVTTVHFTVDWQTVFTSLSGYEDYVTAFILAALVSPVLAPVFE